MGILVTNPGSIAWKTIKIRFNLELNEFVLASLKEGSQCYLVVYMI
jgi:hypothetical protein